MFSSSFSHVKTVTMSLLKVHLLKKTRAGSKGSKFIAGHVFIPPTNSPWINPIFFACHSYKGKNMKQLKPKAGAFGSETHGFHESADRE